MLAVTASALFVHAPTGRGVHIIREYDPLVGIPICTPHCTHPVIRHPDSCQPVRRMVDWLCDLHATAVGHHRTASNSNCNLRPRQVSQLIQLYHLCPHTLLPPPRLQTYYVHISRLLLTQWLSQTIRKQSLARELTLGWNMRTMRKMRRKRTLTTVGQGTPAKTPRAV